MVLKQSDVAPWKKILRQNFTRIEVLADFLELNEEQRKCFSCHPKFSLNLPLRLAQKIKKRTLEDPILKQFLPLNQSNSLTKGFVKDPVGDSNARLGPKLLHKYHGRVLLVCTSACAMHCRYCFRQNFDYDTVDKTFTKELELIEKDKTIREVILSGGDPLSLTNENLDYLVERLNTIEHVKHIRIHTRFPLGIPERIDSGFLSMIKKIRSQIWFVIHCNHATELDQDIINHLTLLKKQGCVLLNQSVLLKGVNDDVETLKQLCETLVDNGIVPYYLHQLDKIEGAGYFEVEEQTGNYLMQQMVRLLPGYAIPKYVREDAGEPNKTLLF